MAVDFMLNIPNGGSAISPLQVITITGAAASIPVSGLSCDSRLYRLEMDVSVAVDSAITVLFNDNAATDQSLFQVGNAGSSIVANRVGTIYTAQPGARGNFYILAKSGAFRHVHCSFTSSFASVGYTNIGKAIWSTTAGEVTKITIAGSANFNSGSKISVYDMGAA
jgi:hypothetical protein